jgi:hypothetical protein
MMWMTFGSKLKSILARKL